MIVGTMSMVLGAAFVPSIRSVRSALCVILTLTLFGCAKPVAVTSGASTAGMETVPMHGLLSVSGAVDMGDATNSRLIGVSIYGSASRPDDSEVVVHRTYQGRVVGRSQFRFDSVVPFENLTLVLLRSDGAYSVVSNGALRCDLLRSGGTHVDLGIIRMSKAQSYLLNVEGVPGGLDQECSIRWFPGDPRPTYRGIALTDAQEPPHPEQGDGFVRRVSGPPLDWFLRYATPVIVSASGEILGHVFIYETRNQVEGSLAVRCKFFEKQAYGVFANVRVRLKDKDSGQIMPGSRCIVGSSDRSDYIGLVCDESGFVTIPAIFVQKYDLRICAEARFGSWDSEAVVLDMPDDVFGLTYSVVDIPDIEVSALSHERSPLWAKFCRVMVVDQLGQAVPGAVVVGPLPGMESVTGRDGFAWCEWGVCEAGWTVEHADRGSGWMRLPDSSSPGRDSPIRLLLTENYGVKVRISQRGAAVQLTAEQAGSIISGFGREFGGLFESWSPEPRFAVLPDGRLYMEFSGGWLALEASMRDQEPGESITWLAMNVDLPRSDGMDWPEELTINPIADANQVLSREIVVTLN